MVFYALLWYFLLKVNSLTMERIPSTSTPPEARSLCVMETFPDLNVTIVFGGYSDPRNAFNDLWSFDLQRKAWSQLAASNDIYPSNFYLASRYNGGSFTSWSEQYFYIFGGMSVSGPLNDLWRFQVDGFLWTQIITYGDIPSPRLKFGYTAFTQDDILKFAVFGGLTMKGDDNGLYL
ncbi:unnamed protein product [Blepharisma stoltei]|uniref:Uncharacterized protein n=1 Tax=Blepharisma stoltei TaxID=1481888 RepID=A0AAU9IWY5_9CILI|nr:unnamed protein product [Blepharisma stoltei]